MEKLKEAFLTIMFFVGIVFFSWALYKGVEAQHVPKKITMQNGTSVVCRTISWGFCGYTFSDCVDNRTYECQNNYSVEKL